MSERARERLPNRRLTHTFSVQCGPFTYIASVGFFPDGRLAEIFLGNGKAGSGSDTNAKDAAVVASIALQYGVPLEVIRKALMRDAHGQANGPLAAALDRIAEVDI